MEEKQFLERNGVIVTNTRLVINNQIYAMSAVVSVKQAVDEPSIAGSIILGVLGLFIVILGVFVNKFISVFGIAMVVAAIIWAAQRKRGYMVEINLSSGESRKLESENKEEIASIIEALNESIIYRG